MSADARIARAQRWKAFFDEPGGIKDMLGHMTIEHVREAAQCEPWQTDRLKKQALMLKLIGELEQTFRRVMDDGKLAEAAQSQAQRAGNVRERKFW